MKTRYKILIVFIQLLAFFSYIGCFVYQTYRTDKELVFVDIPVKYRKGEITGKEYGITITTNRGSHTVTWNQTVFLVYILRLTITCLSLIHNVLLTQS